MKTKTTTFLKSIIRLFQRYRKAFLLLVAFIVILVILIVIVCHVVVGQDRKYVLPANTTKHERVGLVLGAGITKSGKPFRELQARLDVAATALHKGQVDKLILSGDNRIKGYNEPDAMKNYLINVKHVSSSKLQSDYAGRSTYESCDRASKVFGVHETIIYSASTHLPRAIFLCRHLGVTAYGVSSGVEANNGYRRELLADVKAVFNVYVHGPNTVLGPMIYL